MPLRHQLEAIPVHRCLQHIPAFLCRGTFHHCLKDQTSSSRILSNYMVDHHHLCRHHRPDHLRPTQTVHRILLQAFRLRHLHLYPPLLSPSCIGLRQRPLQSHQNYRFLTLNCHLQAKTRARVQDLSPNHFQQPLQ